MQRYYMPQVGRGKLLVMQRHYMPQVVPCSGITCLRWFTHHSSTYALVSELGEGGGEGGGSGHTPPFPPPLWPWMTH